MDGAVCVGRLAGFAGLGEFDEDGFAGGSGGFNAWTPEFLTFLSCGDGIAVALSADLPALAWSCVFGGRVFILVFYFALWWRRYQAGRFIFVFIPRSFLLDFGLGLGLRAVVLKILAFLGGGFCRCGWGGFEAFGLARGWSRPGGGEGSFQGGGAGGCVGKMGFSLGHGRELACSAQNVTSREGIEATNQF